jgi:hypothetical protein
MQQKNNTKQNPKIRKEVMYHQPNPHHLPNHTAGVVSRRKCRESDVAHQTLFVALEQLTKQTKFATQRQIHAITSAKRVKRTPQLENVNFIFSPKISQRSKDMSWPIRYSMDTKVSLHRNAKDIIIPSIGKTYNHSNNVIKALKGNYYWQARLTFKNALDSNPHTKLGLKEYGGVHPYFQPAISQNSKQMAQKKNYNFDLNTLSQPRKNEACKKPHNFLTVEVETRTPLSPKHNCRSATLVSERNTKNEQHQR